MKAVRRAVIDIGTNSVKLLVGDVAGHQVQPLLERSVQTRLGRGFYSDHRLQLPAIEHTARVVAAFAEEAARWQAVTVRVIATSAARDASNGAELIAAVLKSAQARVEIISGEQEADWAFQGVTTAPHLANRPLLIMDAGGGSTQLIAFDGRQRYLRHSFRLGVVRLLEHLLPSDPPKATELAACRTWLQDFITQHIQPALAHELAQHSAGQTILVGTGGSSSLLVTMHLGLTRFERERIEAACLSRKQIINQVERLWSLPIDERKQLAGLPPQKADVILMGAAIHEAIMRQFDLLELRASTRGMRFAALMNAPSP